VKLSGPGIGSCISIGTQSSSWSKHAALFLEQIVVTTKDLDQAARHNSGPRTRLPGLCTLPSYWNK